MYLDATKANQGLFRAFLTPGDPVGDSRAHGLGDIIALPDGAQAQIEFRPPLRTTPGSIWSIGRLMGSPAECTYPCGTIGSGFIRLGNIPDSGRESADNRGGIFPCRVHPPR